MKKRPWYMPGLVLLAWAAPLQADTPPAIESFTLANGLEVVVIPNHRVPAVSHMLWYRVGSADDPPGKSGLAHYHEHMMYQGTTTQRAGEYADIVARHGGQQNAFTGYDATAYYINIAKEHLPLAMSLEANRMRPLTASLSVAEKEREVILEERRSRIENDPKALLAEQINAALFRHHPYQVPVIGWMHEMERLTRNDVLRFHQTWYYPNNAILILSGDITAKEVRPLVERYYGGLTAGNVPGREWNKEPPQNSARRVSMRHANVRQPMWARSYATPSLVSGDTAQALPLLVLSQVLGTGKTSRLYRSLVADRQLASSIDINYDAFTLGPSRFQIAIVPEPEVSLEAMEKAVDEELVRALSDPFNEQEMTRAKTLLKAQSVYAREGLSSMARIMGWLRILNLDKEYFLLWPEKIEAVTAEDVMAAAKATLKPSRSVTGWLLPETAEKP